MLPIIFAALCVAVISAESSSVSSYSSGPSSTRDYEYTGSSYSSGKPSYTDLGSASFITASGSPYSKSDSRFTSESSADSGETRANSFYKSKYGSEAVVNALRQAPSSSTAGVSSAQVASDHASTQYEYPSGAAYYESSNPGTETGGSTASEYPGSYATVTYGERGLPEHHRQPSEYAHVKPVYNAYPGLGEYAQIRPTSFGHSGINNPVVQPALSGGEFSSIPHHQHHHHHHREYPHSYKTYVTSSNGGGGGSIGPATKYQTVFGALKSLFSGGASVLMPDTAPSAAHVPAYYSSNGMHSTSHHAPTFSQSASGGPAYYFGSGPGASSSGSSYSKNYPPMRFMTSNGNGGNKIIVIRDSGSAHSTGYPTNGGTILSSGSSYPTKSKISNFAPSNGGGHAYIVGSPSSLSYTSGTSSGGYPGGYSSGGNFAGGHGGSTFLGYSA